MRFTTPEEIFSKIPRVMRKNILFVSDYHEPKGFFDWSAERRFQWSLDLRRKNASHIDRKLLNGKNCVLKLPTQFCAWVWLGAYARKEGVPPQAITSKGTVVRRLWADCLAEIHPHARLRVISVPSATGAFKPVCPRSDVNPWKYLPRIGSRDRGMMDKYDYLCMIGYDQFFGEVDGDDLVMGSDSEAAIRRALMAIFGNDPDEEDEQYIFACGYDYEAMAGRLNSESSWASFMEVMKTRGITNETLLRKVMKQMVSEAK